ncbi:hypothetical protein TRFO_13136 [Tritrichomonas foetus]|uniref:Centromere protein J C-terminal domain-containing protein n=1 Tax=Tritrichomonas foetus TaxID=1144522 RepID=A0A1J4L086_9EUKA|nr:hypothetical protein TRFO_13136 [Tritrichomonas foetus]|eukprot:OHT16544.1 hypothetical protein TRFO_13136 [Tritrichomonas foetus]
MKGTRKPQKKGSNSLLFSDDDSDLVQFRKLEEAVQHHSSSSSSDIFPDPERLKKKFPNLFSNENTPKKIPNSSSSSDDNIPVDNNADQIMQLTNDLHQAFRLVTQKKAELEKEQQRFLKEKRAFAREKAKYESEQILADTETNSASYLLLKQKYKALKEKYKFKKNEWNREKNTYIEQIDSLNQKLLEKPISHARDFENIKDNYQSTINSNFDVIRENKITINKDIVEKTNNFYPINKNISNKVDIVSKLDDEITTSIANIDSDESEIDNIGIVNEEDNIAKIEPTFEYKQDNNDDFDIKVESADLPNISPKIIRNSNSSKSSNGSFKKQSLSNKDEISFKNNQNSYINKINSNVNHNMSSKYSAKVSTAFPTNISDDDEPSFDDDEANSFDIHKYESPNKNFLKRSPVSSPQSFTKQSSLNPIRQINESKINREIPNSNNYEKPMHVFKAVIPKLSPNNSPKTKPTFINRNDNSNDSEVSPPVNKAVTKNRVSKVSKIPSPPKVPARGKQVSSNKVESNKSSNSKESNVSNVPAQTIVRANIPKRLQESLLVPNFSTNNENNSNESYLKSNIKQKTKHIQSNSPEGDYFYRDQYDVDFDIDLGEVIEEKVAANQKKTIKYFDGTVEIRFSNGTRKITRSNCTYVFYPNNDASQDFPDGARAYKYANGVIELTLPDNTVMYTFTNGQREKHFANGDKEIYYPSGEIKITKSNGDYEMKYPDGKVEKCTRGIIEYYYV